MLKPESILQAQLRIAPYIHRTPVLETRLLNRWLGARVLFKAENLQKAGAFKIRGALNGVLRRIEEGNKPKELVAYSSGNHAQGVAYAGQVLGIPTTICMPGFVSKVKLQATRSYGAEVIVTETRQEAEALAQERADRGAVLLKPFDDDDIIAGQGTACLEVLQDGFAPDAAFATCGGGGLLSGTFLATQLALPGCRVFGTEPQMANDASRSLQSGRIFQWEQTPMTIADGARTLAVAERTFHYLKQLSGFYEIPEDEIIYWTQWLTHLHKMTIEPTSAVAMAGAVRWIATQGKGKTALVMISGGNIDTASQRKIWEKDWLEQVPGKQAILEIA